MTTTTCVRFAVMCGLIVAAVGCDGQPKRPLAVPVDSGGGGATPPPAVIAGAKPAATDAAAEALIARMLAAHTNNDPAKLNALKTHTMTRKGQIALPNAGGDTTWTDTAWAVSAVWPDHYRVQSEIPARGPGTDVMVQNGPTGWKLFRTQGQTDATAFNALERTVMATDAHAEWLVTLVPLLDAAGRVAAPVPGTPEAARVWIGDYPSAVVYTDPKSGLLTRIDYQVNELGAMVPKSFLLFDHKPTNGVLLPTRLEYTQNGRAVTKWSASVLEFPKDTPAEKFQKP